MLSQAPQKAPPGPWSPGPLGYRVAFCGDGYNDMGPFKAAHVGHSFRGGALLTVLFVLREGRNSLVGSYQVLPFTAG